MEILQHKEKLEECNSWMSIASPPRLHVFCCVEYLLSFYLIVNLFKVKLLTQWIQCIFDQSGWLRRERKKYDDSESMTYKC